MQIGKGTTDVTIYFHLRIDSDGKSKTGLVYNSTGAIASYVRTRGIRTAISLITLAAANSAHSDGGFKEVDGTNAKGLYRLDIPDAAFASGVDEVIIHIGFTNVFEESLAIELVDERPGNLKDNAITAAKIDANAIGASEFAQGAADKVWGTAARALTDKANFTLSAAGITGIWEKDISAFSGAGYAGTYLKVLYDDWLNGGRLDLLLDAVKAKTDNLPSGLPKNVALANFEFLMVLSSDHITVATGKTLTEEISKDGGAFAACTNNSAEVGSGVYKISLTQAEMNADVIVLKFTETNCDQRTVTILTSS